MKKIFITAVFVMLMTVSTYAQQKVKINIDGRIAEIQNYYESVEGFILVPVREAAEILGYDVDWDGESSTIQIKKGENLFKISVKNSFCEYNGVKDELNFSVDVIDGSTYLPLDIIVEAIGYNIVWNDNEALIITDIDNTEILVDFGIISEEALNKRGYITNREAVGVLNKISNAYGSLTYWYEIDALAPLDYIDDDFKSELIKLISGNAPVMNVKEVVNMDFDGYITNYEAMVYVTRMVADTYGCGGTSKESEITLPSEFYEIALSKGLIDSIDLANADEPILRDDFYRLVTRGLFVKHSVGGYVTTSRRLADYYIFKDNNDEQKEEIKTYEYELTGKVHFNEDMSLSWELDNKEISDSVDINVYDKEGELLTGVTTTLNENKIDTEWLIQLLIDEYPKKADNMVITYYDHDEENNTYIRWNFKIDLSVINVVTEGEAIKPGVYKCFEKQWVPEYITLTDGQFKKGAYYVIRSCEHRYRKDDLNAKSTAIFTVEENTDIYDNSNHDYFDAGSVYLEDAHIQELTITGGPDIGFTLHITPDSEEKFKIA